MLFWTPNETATRVHGWLAHTPQPDDPPPIEPGEPDAPPIGDPPPEPGEVPHSARSGRFATGAPAVARVHNFYVLVTRRSKFLPAI